ncbi:hypothetical protein EI77_02934 [Prosthecobacter fusiformis]|uniref:Uncharacterized protein n=1 Tax=Prosthecobacter fusiformis TaxID=48464 RepID=A0A4V3FF31_9BACT|nr:hypothetical protein [Prosthecobacter fusiformis]TDU69283.1 hypothetical protein EI77_02934 [Prosthecobacter fusiformis]
MKNLLLCLLCLSTTVHAAAPPDHQARFLAGLSVDATELEPLAREPSWQNHASSFHRAWLDLEERQLSRIRTWMPTTLNYIYEDPSPLFYTFSGPDFLYANAFFPNASTYILCGREPVGTLPDVASLSPGALHSALGNLRTALNAILSFSFFITADMKNDLSQTQLSGTIPVLYVFLARAGCRIVDAELVKVSDSGELTAGKSKTPGVKITFIGNTGRTQTLYYFTTDLSNWGIKSNAGFVEFCKKQGQGNAFVKAASYLMHMEEFSSVRNFLLSNTRNLIQDDSGIPLKYFSADQWMISLYGNYPGPIELFQQHFQTDLDMAFKTAVSGDLPFGVGYQWKPGISSLIIGTSFRSAPRAQAVEE